MNYIKVVDALDDYKQTVDQGDPLEYGDMSALISLRRGMTPSTRMPDREYGPEPVKRFNQAEIRALEAQLKAEGRLDGFLVNGELTFKR